MEGNAQLWAVLHQSWVADSLACKIKHENGVNVINKQGTLMKLWSALVFEGPKGENAVIRGRKRQTLRLAAFVDSPFRGAVDR